MDKKIQDTLAFLHDLELLKSVTRHSWLSSGRQESVPEHSWRMSMMAIVLEDEFPKLDMRKVIEMCLIHDLGEVYDGDIPAFRKRPDEKIREEIAVKRIVQPLPPNLQKKIIELWKEYENAETLEAKLVKALDKLEVIIQHNEADISTWAPEEFEFQFTYGKKFTDFHPFLKKFREEVDMDSSKKIAEAQK
ncbi:HD domain-containing protein [Candidatus Woesearchaeota archaeon]|nr:HD domain-containing protein [Candidatus Woesearchaeota archaeon]